MSFIGLDVRYSMGGGGDEPELLQRMSVAFERAGAEVARLGKHVYPKMVPLFEEELGRQFAAEGQGPNRGGWAPLSEAYAAWKAKEYPGQPTLQREGNLHAALTASTSPFAMRTYDDSAFDFGTAGLDYASFHQTGTRRMPSRPPYDFGDALEQGIQRAALEGVREAIAEAGADEFLSEGAL